ncbi:MAG: PBP1A family penicillin-binding protein [Alphaproteobacteria bacterium]|nr:PBP1A family penicillin-binding protein [Alphaproteobacteria bacterium]
MSDWFSKQGGRDKLINWLGIDSKIDATLAESGARIRNVWNSTTSFFARFRLRGWKRACNELASEMFSLGLGGFFILYAAALPALLEFDEEKFRTGQFSVKFLDSEGNEIGRRGILHNDAVPLEEIPDHVIKATLATEDRRFFEHFGLDVFGTMRALIENLRANNVVQGGSSITQQLAKNIFLSPERSLKRKIKELFLAFLLESRFTKREILKMYLDRAYMGGGAFGVEAAAQFYFGKSVRDLSLAEAAVLAGLYKAPTKYAPHLNLPSSRARTNEVLSNLVEAGFYTAAQVHEARLHPAKFIEHGNTESPDWFLDWAFEEVQRIARGKYQYVLTARTTIDLEMQAKAEQALITTLRKSGRYKRARSGALVALEVDGALKAMVGGPDYGESQFNRASHALRQPGSSFKPYVYATALENGYTSMSRVRDVSPRCGRWSPKNYSGSRGSGRRLTLTEALSRSLNTVAVFLSLNVGREKVIALMNRIGVKGVRKTCSRALGDGGLTPLAHTGGYATFANNGKMVRPYAIVELFNAHGELVYSRERDEPPAPQVIKPKVVHQLNQMLHSVVTSGTGRRAQLPFTHVAGKTGTSSSYRDAWFMGYTGKLVTGVWIGNDDFRPTGGVTGGSLPAQTWQAFMSVAHTSMDFPPIPGLRPHPVQVAERQRLAQMRLDNPLDAAEKKAASGKTKRTLSKQSRDVLFNIETTMRKAAGLPPPDPAPQDTPESEPNQRSDRKRTGTPSDRRSKHAPSTGTPVRQAATATPAP